VPLGTVQKIFSGETASPRYTTLLALEQVLLDHRETFSSTVHESVAPYLTKRQAQYAATCTRLFLTQLKCRHSAVAKGLLYTAHPLNSPAVCRRYLTADTSL